MEKKKISLKIPRPKEMAVIAAKYAKEKKTQDNKKKAIRNKNPRTLSFNSIAKLLIPLMLEEMKKCWRIADGRQHLLRIDYEKLSFNDKTARKYYMKREDLFPVLNKYFRPRGWKLVYPWSIMAQDFYFAINAIKKGK